MMFNYLCAFCLPMHIMIKFKYRNGMTALYVVCMYVCIYIYMYINTGIRNFQMPFSLTTNV